MQRHIITTKDGSPTLFVPELDEHYHSIHGAIQESQHVFIKHGLHHQLALKSSLSILEVGFGTGLNALLTLMEAGANSINYTAIEAYPLSLEEVDTLDYSSLLKGNGLGDTLLELHQREWESPQLINDHFTLTKTQQKLEHLQLHTTFDLIYFDAFAPSAQPELWTEYIFKTMYELTKTDGILVTYCAKGSVKRAMKAAGYTVEPLPGPPGKREITRCLKS